MASVLARPKYGNSELGDILMQQYPPLFHAATNVPSFINAMKHLPNMRHLTVKTPGQQPKERYRRDIVDYALISLRISLERTPLTKLTKLSLSAVHPSAFNYLRPMPGFGPSPSSTRRWRQIRKLYISVESWDFYGPSPGLDHLKIIDDYIRLFAPQVDKFGFTWLGRKGPCPLALSADPLFAPPRSAKKLFAEVTSPMSPLPPRPSRRPLRMPRLRYMQVRNTTMNEPQLRDLVAAHAATVREFDFENVALINDGSWDDALAPLMSGAGSDVWSRRSIGGSSERSFRPMPGLSRSGSGAGSGSGVTSTHEDEQLPASSAAAAAASKELFDVDLDGMVFGGVNDADAFGAGVEEWARGVIDAAPHEDHHPIYHSARIDEEAAEKAETVDDGGLASDIEAAKQASLGFSTKLKKRRIRKKKPRKPHGDGGAESEAAGEMVEEPRRHLHHLLHHPLKHSRSARSDETHSRDRSRHKHSRSDETHSRDRSRHRSRSRRRHHGHGHRRRHHSEEPEMPEMPDTFIAEVLASDDEAAIRPLRRQPTPPQEMDVSAPILNPDPLPVLLQPAVYDPSAKAGPLVGDHPLLRTAEASTATLPPPLTKISSNKSLGAASTTSSSSVAAARAAELAAGKLEDGGLSAVQLRIEAELLEAEEEAAARSSALRRAKETVLAKLSREFCKRKAAAAATSGGSKDSAAVMGLPGLNLGTGVSVGYGCAAAAATAGASGGGGFGSRWGSGLREGLFGRSVAHVGAVQADHRSMESQTALVPLIFSRS